MKIIDEKGRLFGKINVIDCLAILFLFSLIPMLYFGYKVNREKAKILTEASKVAELPKELPKKHFIEIEIDCLFIKVEPKTAALISVGDREVDENADTIGEILSMGELSPHLYQFNIGLLPKRFKNLDPILKQVPVTLRIKAEIRGDSLYYKDRPILNNVGFEFKTDKYRVEAIPVFSKIGYTEDLEERVKHLEYMVSLLEQGMEVVKNKVLNKR